MVFSSSIFLFIFLPVVLISYYNPFFKSRSFKNSILLLSSLFFYAWGEPAFVFLMIFSIFVNFELGKKVFSYGTTEKNNLHLQKIYLVVSVIWNVGLLFVFKYLSFLSNVFSDLFFTMNFPVIEIQLPIGISFFTFQIMSYVFDVYYKKVPVQKNVFNLALYVSFFPQLIAGPIVRYETIENEIENRVETQENITKGTKRFVLGLAKKCLVANYLAVIADLIFESFSSSVNFSCLNAWIGAVAYTLQIYFDFSGYSDMAIGLGLIFGFHFEENFNHPYMAKSITDFWRRWHISLSTWFRDYVYIPLGGNRCSKSRAFFNMFVVWALTGIWHGAAFTFWIWGIYYFILLVIEKSINIDSDKKVINFFMHILTLFFVIIGWVIFRSNNLNDAYIYIKALFNFSLKEFLNFFDNYYIKNGGVILLIGIVASFPLIDFSKKLKLKILDSIKESGYFYALANKLFEIFENIILLLAFVFSVLVCIKSTYNPFIYFNF